jgi:hypothetical protein
MVKHATATAAALSFVVAAFLILRTTGGSDPLGLSALTPIVFFVAWAFAFFFIWTPALLIALVFRRKSIPSEIVHRTWLILIASLVPFLFLLYSLARALGIVP